MANAVSDSDDAPEGTDGVADQAGGDAGTTVVLAPDPEKAVELAGRIRREVALNVRELADKGVASRCDRLRKRFPTLFVGHEDTPTGRFYLDAKATELATNYDLDPETVRRELERRREDAPSLRAAVEAFRRARDPLV